MSSNKKESYLAFIDTLFAIVIGFMLIEFKQFGLGDFYKDGWIAILSSGPFIVLYMIYMFKLGIYWYESKKGLKLLEHYYGAKISREHYVGMILVAFFVSQLISSIINNWETIENDPNLAFNKFLVWLVIGIIFADALPTLFLIIPKSQKYLKESSDKNNYIKDHENYLVNTLRINAFVNIIIPVSSILFYLILNNTKIDKLALVYCVSLYLLILNIGQEIYLKQARQRYLKISYDEIG